MLESKNKQIIISAGGLGTRLNMKEIPKSMVEINGIPLLEDQINFLKTQGFREFFLLVNHLSHVIFDYFKDGSRWGVLIHYITDPYPLGTMGSLSLLKGLIKDDPVPLVYGDVFFRVDLRRFCQAHIEKKAYMSAMVHPNSHPEDSDLFNVDDDFFLEEILLKTEKKPQYYRNLASASLYCFNRQAIDNIPYGIPGDLIAHYFKVMVASEKIFCYSTHEYMKDMGTIKRLKQVKKDIHIGIPFLQKYSALVLDLSPYLQMSSEDNQIIPQYLLNLIQIANQNCILLCGLIDNSQISEYTFHDLASQLDTYLAHSGNYLDHLIHLSDKRENYLSSHFFSHLINQYKINPHNSYCLSSMEYKDIYKKTSFLWAELSENICLQIISRIRPGQINF